MFIVWHISLTELWELDGIAIYKHFAPPGLEFQSILSGLAESKKDSPPRKR